MWPVDGLGPRAAGCISRQPKAMVGRRRSCITSGGSVSPPHGRIGPVSPFPSGSAVVLEVVRDHHLDDDDADALEAMLAAYSVDVSIPERPEAVRPPVWASPEWILVLRWVHGE